MDEGLISGCDLPLIGRSGVVGVLAALKRTERVVLRTELFQMDEGGCEVHRGEVYRPRAFHRREHLLVVLFERASCCYESELSINR
jgi:hypothetical protein